MAADLADRSFSLLPSVFELLLHNADNIIDDTSIEKLLTWLGEVSSQRNSLEALLSGKTGAREFLQSDKLFESSTSLAFALRLCGLLWRHEECFEDLESMLGLFKKSTLDSNGLWGEAVVRHAWFSGLQSLCTHRAGRKALQHLSECFSKAAEHVTDSSMFVAQAARTFTAKLLISSFVDDSISTNSLASVLPNTASLLKTLKAKLSVEPMTSNTGNPNYGIAALELIRILLDTNAKAGQDVLRFSGLFTATIKLLYVSDGTYCSKFVDIICEMVSSSSPWGLEWDRLLTVCHEEEGADNTFLMLLQLPLVLMERQFTSLAVALISGLAFPEGTLPSSFPSTWYQCLYAVLDAVLAALYPSPPSGTDTICNGSVGTTRRCHDIVKEIISLCEKENGVDKVVKGEIRQLLCPGRMSEKSKLNVLIKVIGAVEGLASKAPQACPVSTSKWSKYSLAVLANCALGDVPNEEYVLPPGLQGDLKLLKASLSAALSLIKVQVMVQGNDGDEILYEAAKLLVKIVKNSESEAMVIVAALKALGELLNVSSSTTESLLATTPQTTGAPALKHPELCDRNSCLTTGSPTRKRHGPCDQGNEIEGATTRSEPKAQASDKNSDSPDMKRPKKCTEQGNLVSSKPTVSPTIGDNVLHAQAPNTSTDSPPGSSGSIVASGESFSCELGMALHQSLRDQMWEIKDSVLELVLSLLQTQQDPFILFLEQHNLPCAIWRAVDDCESYVRASAWLVIGHIICCASLHIYNCQGSLITEEDILTKIVYVLQHDSEAIPRRSAVECLTLSLQHRVSALDIIFSAESSSVTTLTSSVLSCAMKDFDWEVKLRGLSLVEAIVRRVATGIPSGLELSGVLERLGALRALFEAVTDCDSLVCEKALNVLELLKRTSGDCAERVNGLPGQGDGILGKKYSNNSRVDAPSQENAQTREEQITEDFNDSPINSVEDLAKALSRGFLACDWDHIVQRLDIQSMREDCTCADSIVRSEPACMLEDILSAATDHEENLLDCY